MRVFCAGEMVEKRRKFSLFKEKQLASFVHPFRVSQRKILPVSFSIYDSLIMAIYLTVILSIGFFYSRKKEKTTEDYFLAGRNSGWVAVGLSIFATNISSEHFIGLAGAGASRGFAVAQFELMAIFILIILGWFIAPIVLKSGVQTMPEFLEKRFDRRSRKVFAVISIATYLFTKITVTLFAGGLLFTKIFGINIYTSAIIIVLITGLYSVTGGATAIVKTHYLQAILMILGAVTLTLFGLNEVGGFSALHAKLPSDFFTMFKGISDPDYPWTGIIFGAPIIAFWYWCTDQFIMQRLLGAKNIENARRGSLLAAFLKITPIFILVLPGLISAALYPEAKGDDAYPALMTSNLLPVGVKGFVVTGLVAAIMSSLASAFNSSSAIFTNDYYKPRNPESSERKLVLIGRLATMVTVVGAILMVSFVKLISSQVYLFLQNVQAFISPPITAVFIFGLFFKQITGRAAIWTLVIGETIGILRLVAQLLVQMNMTTSPLLISFVSINFLHFAILLFLFCSFLILAFSFAAKPERKEISHVPFLFPDTLKEIKFNLNHLGSVSRDRLNIVISAFLLLLILGLWSIWN